MNTAKLRTAGLAMATAFSIMACGGGGSGVGGLAGGGVTGTGASYGTVTGFGSVFVNGVKYNTDAAAITLDDNPGVEDDLRVGMVVKVAGTVNDDGMTGTAEKIEYHDSLEGTVSEPPDPATNTMVVMGQTVSFDNLTVFEDSTVPPSTTGTLAQSTASVTAGNIVEVSGWTDAGGEIHAARVERKAESFGTGAELEITGVITNLDAVAQTFAIGGLTVDYSTAVSIEGTLADGQRVEVKSTQALSGTIMTATQIKQEDHPFAGVTSGRVEIEGFITALTDQDDFTVLGTPVKTTNATVYENGVAADIALGKKIEVKGVMGSDGVLTAAAISYRLPNRIEIEARVDSVSNGTVTVLGIPVQVTTATQLEDDSDAKLRPFALTDLNAGDFVEIRAYLKDSDVVAARLERDDLDADRILQGPVSAKAPDQSSLTILDVAVNTGAGITYRLQSDGPAVTRTAFYDAVTEDITVVKAKGTWNGSSLNAVEVEIEG